MRKIEFRARAKNKKCWVVGDFIHCENGYSIIEKKGGCIKVKPETIGQFTGLCDKNGEKIYEGDILDDNDGKPTFVAVWQNGCFCFAGIAEYFDYLKYGYADYTETVAGDFIVDICSVLGNVYDNPELLGG